jgi:hypothetical protein
MNRNDTKTMSIPEAGRRYYDLAPGASYRAARAGDLPTVQASSRFSHRAGAEA